MPLVANSSLPAFTRLTNEGRTIIPRSEAERQDIRELHIGLLNMMPDAALEATERQFFRLIGESNPIAQFYVHPFTLDTLPRGIEAQAHIAEHYESFDSIKEQGLDALIITGANVVGPELSTQPFWNALIDVIDFACNNVTSTLCSCLATHAVLEFHYGQKRRPLGYKCWGVYSHRVVERRHPLVHDVNTRFDVPHSRFNQIDHEQFLRAGLHVLVESEEVGVHLAVSEDLLRLVFFQGHPEYDSVSLFKEYKREVGRYVAGHRPDYPPFPENYMGKQGTALLEEHRDRIEAALQANEHVPELPESLIIPNLDNTWRDTAEAVVGNWIGMVYQLTHLKRRHPFKAGVNSNDPLGLRNLLQRAP